MVAQAYVAYHLHTVVYDKLGIDIAHNDCIRAGVVVACCLRAWTLGFWATSDGCRTVCEVNREYVIRCLAQSRQD